MSDTAANAGIKTRFTTAAHLIPKVEAAPRKGRLSDVLRPIGLVSLPIIDETDDLLITQSGANQFVGTSIPGSPFDPPHSNRRSLLRKRRVRHWSRTHDDTRPHN